MERKIKITLLLVIGYVLTSCIKTSINNIPIPEEEILGLYIDKNEYDKINIKSDYSYERTLIIKDSSIIENGEWKYFCSDKLSKIPGHYSKNIIYLYKDSFNNDIHSNYSHLYACYKYIYFGPVILTRGYQGDPDGAPKLKWLEKSE